MIEPGSTFYVKVENLKPTQFALGFKEVEHKVELIKKMNEKKLQKYLIEKVTPVVIGPGKKLWLIDHHHHCRSLLECGVKEAFVVVKADLHHLKEKEFFKYMKEQKWVNLYDENAVKQKARNLPPTLTEMTHDHFRSLAWGVREGGGFHKVDEVPFFEFRWGDYFRKFLKKKLVKDDFSLAVDTALKLASRAEAESLPGFISKEKR